MKILKELYAGKHVHDDYNDNMIFSEMFIYVGCDFTPLFSSPNGKVLQNVYVAQPSGALKKSLVPKHLKVMATWMIFLHHCPLSVGPCILCKIICNPGFGFLFLCQLSCATAAIQIHEEKRVRESRSSNLYQSVKPGFTLYYKAFASACFSNSSCRCFWYFV